MTETSSQGIPPWLNKSMSAILRSPLHGMISKTILLIQFTGRKSGKTYVTPVSYSTQDGKIVIFTHANWWKNLNDGAPVMLRLRGQNRHGTAETIADDKAAITKSLLRHLEQVPGDARFYGVSLDAKRKPNPEQAAQAAQNTVMIQVSL